MSLLLNVLGHHRKEQILRTYVLTVADKQGAKHTVQAIGVDHIIEVTHAPKVKKVIALFPVTEQEQAGAFDRPHGTVHLLLVMESRSLHSKDGRE